MSTVTIDLNAKPLENQARAQALQTLANLDIDNLQKLEQLAKSANAVKVFVEKWGMIKMFLGLK